MPELTGNDPAYNNINALLKNKNIEAKWRYNQETDTNILILPTKSWCIEMGAELQNNYKFNLPALKKSIISLPPELGFDDKASGIPLGPEEIKLLSSLPKKSNTVSAENTVNNPYTQQVATGLPH